ncbi:Rha family transcriptional regulator [Vibrio fluvialis]|uniref:Rha family transcriptional regulator n=1 Tax=Vibrio fluvialis TaxID=676 RepID=UPI001EEC03A1|nr:Rha family transcriptional regulator [Vibrio fluvialis]MCG6365108.1 Rha family transcriptional regulator [Vibrio fluvialis]
MSSREIAELTGSRHDNVKISMERMKNSGVIGFTATQEKPSAQGGRPLTVYNVNKRDIDVMCSQLNRPNLDRSECKHRDNVRRTIESLWDLSLVSVTQSEEPTIGGGKPTKIYHGSNSIIVQQISTHI